MSTNFVMRSGSGLMLGATSLMLGVCLILTACASYTPSNKDGNANLSAAEATAATAEAGPEVSALDESDSSKVDQTLDDWEKSRANYLRSLDYAQVEQQNNDLNDYLLKTNLIETRYHVKDSETAMYVEKDYLAALDELRQAEHRFDEAIKMARKGELVNLKAEKPDLDKLLKKAQSAVEHKCICTQPAGYHEVEARLETLITSL